MDEEIKSIERIQTWDLVDLLADKTHVGVKGCTKQKSMKNEILKSLKKYWLPKGLFNNSVLIMVRHSL